MATIFQDFFDRSDSTTMGTPDIGTSWTERLGDWEILSQVANVKTVSGTGEEVCHTNGLSSADYYVEAKMRIPTSVSNYHGLLARRVNYGGSDSDFYSCLNYNGTHLYIFEKIGSFYNIITSGTWTHAADTYYTLRLKVQGSTVTAYADTVEICSATDTSLSAAGDAAIKSNGVANVKFNDFVVDDLAANNPRRERFLMGAAA